MPKASGRKGSVDLPPCYNDHIHQCYLQLFNSHPSRTSFSWGWETNRKNKDKNFNRWKILSTCAGTQLTTAAEVMWSLKYAPQSLVLLRIAPTDNSCSTIHAVPFIKVCWWLESLPCWAEQRESRLPGGRGWKYEIRKTLGQRSEVTLPLSVFCHLSICITVTHTILPQLS